MNIRIQAFCLLLLTFVGNFPWRQHQKQLNVDCCCYAAAILRQQTHEAATTMAMAATAIMENRQILKGNDLEIAKKRQRQTADQYAMLIGDITAATTTTTTTTATMAAATTLTAPSLLKTVNKLNKQNIKKFKNHNLTQNFPFDFRESVAKYFANDSPSTTTIGAHTLGNTTESMEPLQISAAAELPHQTERRHTTPTQHEKLLYTKELQIKQGRLIGIVRRFQASTGLRDVAQYLGLPYAEAPVDSRRFMPPGTPLPWQGLKIARHLPPVCPQKLPDVSIQSGAKMSRGRYKHLTRLMPYLKTESEDCLYLNLYVPHEATTMTLMESSQQRYPVLVYLHGESFEWNSGNAYDGSVLASYGDVIVVTVNYRLGVLGFMRPSIDEHDIANFALLDQIAALHWIKEHIVAFGGDNTRVTLMGHGTGAACVNYLMVSPVASGLFHRAILMSGSAMSDWAASNHTLQLTMQIAQALDCHTHAGVYEDMVECLRQRRYQDILKIPTSFPQFSTSLGPIVDGHVIPNQPYKVMGHYTEYFSRYDLLFGITESESYHTLGALALEEGLRENERDNLLRFYMQSRFDVRPDLALAATLKKYQDLYNNPIKATNMEHRDVVLEIISDARVVGPLLQTGLFHADVNRRNYMYVFGHNSAAGPHASLPHSIMGEELAFIFGAPLAPAGPFPATNYSSQEKLLSEAVMAYWTNFVKTGNPKAPWKGTFINSYALEWDRYDVDWPEFNKRTQAYLNIGIPPSIGYKYRQIYMNFWNKELPDELNQIAAIQEQQQPFLQQQLQQQLLKRMHTAGRDNVDGTTSPFDALSAPAMTTSGSDLITGHMSKYGTRDNVAEDPVRTLKLLLQEPLGGGNGAKPLQVETAENMYNSPPTFGHVHKLPTDVSGTVGGEFYTLPNGSTSMYNELYAGTVAHSDIGAHQQQQQQQQQHHEVLAGLASNEAVNQSAEQPPIAKSETTLQLLIGLIVVFIVLNVIIYSTFLLQKRRKATTMKRKLGVGILSYDGATDDELKRTTKKHGDGDGNDSYIMDSLTRKSNTYEAIKTERRRSPINGYTITRQLSSSTVDTHTKVCEWMSANGTLPRAAAQLSHSGSFAQPPAKGQQVAAAATPQARSQELNELTKLKADSIGGHIIICQDVEVSDQALLTPQNSLDASRYELQRQHSTATEPSDAILIPQPQQQHLCTDADDMLPNYELITSFVHADDVDADINVTSRDESKMALYELAALTPAQQLALLKQRNYPKVLPTNSQRLTDSPPMTNDLTNTYKRNSLPPNSFLPSFAIAGKQAPLPPPRTISTLGRKPSLGRRCSNIMTTSPLQLAKDITADDDDDAEALANQPITQKTLIVGPIVPKARLADATSNYTTLQRHNNDKQLQQNNSETIDAMHLRRQPPTTLQLAGGLCGSFQSFESVPPTLVTEPPPPPPPSSSTSNAAHHTERVYAIQPSTASAPTTPGYTSAGWPAPNGAIYAQPIKSASRTSLIPRMLPLVRDNQLSASTTSTNSLNTNMQETATATATAETQAVTAINDRERGIAENTSLVHTNTIETSNQQQQQQQTSTVCNQMTAALTAAMPSNVSLTTTTTATIATTTSAAAITRIPQLQRNCMPQQTDAQQINNVNPNSNTSIAKSQSVPTTTTTTTTTTTPTTTKNNAAVARSASFMRTSSTYSSTSTTTTSSSASCNSSNSSCCSSSSSSTGTVRTELQQHQR